MHRWFVLFALAAAAAAPVMAEDAAPAPAPPAAAPADPPPAAPPAPPAAPAEDAAAPDAPGGRERAVRDALTEFWLSMAEGDSRGFRSHVDLPLTLQELRPEGGAGERFVVTEAGWPEWQRAFPVRPVETEQPLVNLRDIRLEWIGSQSCLAVYNVDHAVDVPAGDRPDGGAAPADGAASTPAGAGPRHMALLVWRNGWKVVVSTIPG
jgi:hypothetical protein